ncbi:hypothetical protein VNO77_44828 [Canavalia gladiata]|uniref:Uncharacterized protein n=1 Tax=Canavalia gladiata TaxID=3824 RepID=A0AAN9JYX4_CANGL
MCFIKRGTVTTTSIAIPSAQRRRTSCDAFEHTSRVPTLANHTHSCTLSIQIPIQPSLGSIEFPICGNTLAPLTYRHGSCGTERRIAFESTKFLLFLEKLFQDPPPAGSLLSPLETRFSSEIRCPTLYTEDVYVFFLSSSLILVYEFPLECTVLHAEP